MQSREHGPIHVTQHDIGTVGNTVNSRLKIMKTAKYCIITFRSMTKEMLRKIVFTVILEMPYLDANTQIYHFDLVSHDRMLGTFRLYLAV